MKQTPTKQDKPTPGARVPLASCAGVADRAVGGEAARGAGGRGGAVPLGNTGTTTGEGA